MDGPPGPASPGAGVLVVAGPPVVGELVGRDHDGALVRVGPEPPAVHAAPPAVQPQRQRGGGLDVRQDSHEVVDRARRQVAVRRGLPAGVVVQRRGRLVEVVLVLPGLADTIRLRLFQFLDVVKSTVNLPWFVWE